MVKLTGIMVFSVFVDSKSILGLFYGKKCSEIVFFPRCLLSTNRDLTLVCLACIFCRPEWYLLSYFSRRYLLFHDLDDDTRRLA